MTVEKRTEHESWLPGTEADYHAVFDLAGVGVVQADPGTGRFLRVNPKMCEITGYSEEELLDMTLSEITHPDDRREALEGFRRMLRGEAPEHSTEERYVCKDGRVVWVSVNARVVRDEAGEPLRTVAVVQDITDRKRAEEALQYQLDLTRTITNNAADSLFLWDAEGCVTFMNPTAERTFGWRQEELLGEVFHDRMHHHHPDGRPYPISECPLVRVFESGRTLRDHEELFFRKDGAPIEVACSHAPIVVGGKITGGVLVVRDITERKRAEEQMHEIREAERRRMARDMHDEALQDLTHALQAMRDTQARSKVPEVRAELAREIEALERANLGLRSAIYDLRLEEGDREQNFVELLEALVELNRRRSPGREIELFVEDDFSSSLEEGGKAELLRIVREALANARRHSEASRIRVAVGVAGRRLWIEVSDDGRGFDPAKVPAGMGIRGMRERARTLRGDLEISSEPGEGTRVRLEVVAKREEEEPEEVRILLVEDHASFRQAAATVFEREPEFTVVGQAGSLAEAREMLDGVDVAIIDLGLPDGYGGELIKELRTANRHAMALVLTASFDRADMAQAAEFGAAGILHKSADMEEVVDAVRRLRAGETLLPLEEVVELLRFAGSRRDQEHEARQAIARLTPREKEVLRALAEGLDGEEIAERLSISAKTERNHIASIFAKLGVHSRLQALVFALRHGVVDIPR